MRRNLILLLAITALFTSMQLHAQECPDGCELFIPNTLTPDCDDVDCTLLKVISNCPFKKFEFTLYNRWGVVLFESKDPKMVFDCTGQPSGSYVWTLKGKFCNGQAINKQGQLYILN